jgi:hypothetical protein
VLGALLAVTFISDCALVLASDYRFQKHRRSRKLTLAQGHTAYVFCSAVFTPNPVNTQPRMTLACTIRLYKLPAEPVAQGLRPMTPADNTLVWILGVALGFWGKLTFCCVYPSPSPLSTPSKPHHHSHA